MSLPTFKVCSIVMFLPARDPINMLSIEVTSMIPNDVFQLFVTIVIYYLICHSLCFEHYPHTLSQTSLNVPLISIIHKI